MRISDWSSDVCSSDLLFAFIDVGRAPGSQTHLARLAEHVLNQRWGPFFDNLSRRLQASFGGTDLALWALVLTRSEEHTSELQSLMRISSAVFCLKKKNNIKTILVYYYTT